MTSLLPPNSTAAEQAIEQAKARAFALPVSVDQLWSAATCPAALLPWLAWALSVDSWDGQWSEERQRAVIAASIGVHRRKGTVGAVKAALLAAGYGEAILREAWSYPKLGRMQVLGQSWRLGLTGATWADYEIDVPTAISRRDADALASRLALVAPARCRLRRIYLSGVRHVLGRETWALGNQVPLGGVYNYEVT